MTRIPKPTAQAGLMVHNNQSMQLLTGQAFTEYKPSTLAAQTVYVYIQIALHTVNSTTPCIWPYAYNL